MTSHGHHPRLVTDSAAEASLVRWLVRLETSGKVPVIGEQVRGLVLPAQARTERSVTVDVGRFGDQSLRVPSRCSQDARDRMLATWRADVLADLDSRNQTVLAGPPERITGRGHEVALVQMLEHRAATGKIVDNRFYVALYGALRRARAAEADESLAVLGQRLLADLEGVPRPVRTRAPVVV